MMRHCDTYNQMYNHELDLTSSLTRKNLAYVHGIEKNEYQTKLKKRIMNNSKKKKPRMMNIRGPIIQLPPSMKFLSVESIVLTLKRNRTGVKRLGCASSINVFNGFRKRAPNIRLSLP